MMKPKRVEKVMLDAEVREGRGKGAAAGLRREGRVPGVVYKAAEPALALQVSARELARVLHTKAGGNVLIQLAFKGKSKEQLKGHAALASGENVVLVKELQYHPVSHEVLHVDFHQVSLTQRITVSVPLSFQGEAVGVRQSGGILEHLRWQIEVECLPTEIPAEIPVEISGLELGKTLHVRDVPLPTGVRAVTDAEQPVIACVEPKAEEIPVPAAEAAAAAEPEVIKQKKPEEGATVAPGQAEAGKEKPEKGEKGKEKAPPVEGKGKA